MAGHLVRDIMNKKITKTILPRNALCADNIFKLLTMQALFGRSASITQANAAS